MMARLLADVAVARLGLPVPMAKLVTIQAIATALDHESTAKTYADALVAWTETRELESQCLEALCPLLIKAPRSDVMARIRRSIARPSIASDLLVSLATGNPVVLPSWTGCHSGPAPELLALEKEESTLRAGTFIPPLFTTQLENLQEFSGHPFMRQWAFEYSLLRDRNTGKGDGHLDYFLDSERSNVGQFLALKGHLARSAYLRTLACAVEHWDMPDDVAQQYAVAAFPAEPIFLGLAPQAPPAWAPFAHKLIATEVVGSQKLALAVVQHVERELQHRVMHCSMMVADDPLHHVEIEVFAVVRTHENIDAEKAVDFYHHMLGKISPSRDDLRAFVAPTMGTKGAQQLGFVPILLPLIGAHVGYLQSDLLGRVPYMPISTTNVPKLELTPGANGAILYLQNREVGKWDWWLWNWKPTRPRGWPSPMACCASLSPEVARQIADDLNGHIEHVWKITTWQRDQHYGEWTRTKEFGRLADRNEASHNVY